MARKVRREPFKLVALNLPIDLIARIDDEVERRGCMKRDLFEQALRRELGLPEPAEDESEGGQGVLQLGA